MESIFLFGASGHGKVIADIVEDEGLLAVAGFIDAGLPVGSERYGYPVLGSEDDLPRLCAEHGVGGGIVAIGDNAVRARVAERILALVPEFAFETAVHSTAAVARGAVLGEGTVVMAQAVVGADAHTGRHCIVNTAATLDHDGVLEEYASLGPGAHLGGNTSLGAYAHVGLGASVIHGVRIGPNTVVGAGAAVVADLPGDTLALGVPARATRKREPGERYY